MQVSQIFITDNVDTKLPSFMAGTTASVKAAFPDLPHAIYNRVTLREFIAEHYAPEVVEAYDMLVPYAYQSDLGRYCLLHTLGGWYVDISVRMVLGLQPPPHVAWLAFRDDSPAFTNTSFACSNALIFARPGCPVMHRAINMVVENVQARYYGTRPIDPTGPTLFGRALALQGPSDNATIAEMAQLTPRHQVKNRAFLLPDGQIMAWAKPKHVARGGDLTGLGAEGVNNYNELWQQRQIYRDI